MFLAPWWRGLTWDQRLAGAVQALGGMGLLAIYAHFGRYLHLPDLVVSIAFFSMSTAAGYVVGAIASVLVLVAFALLRLGFADGSTTVGKVGRVLVALAVLRTTGTMGIVVMAGWGGIELIGNEKLPLAMRAGLLTGLALGSGLVATGALKS